MHRFHEGLGHARKVPRIGVPCPASEVSGTVMIPAVQRTTRTELAYLVVTIVVALVVAVSVSLLAGAVVLALLSVGGRAVIRRRA